MVRIMAAAMLTLGVSAATAGEVAPKVPIDKSKGECVLPADQMRKQHMNILMHRRDETMYRGVRAGKSALDACLTCHMVKDEQGKPVTVADERHFCRVCHDYTAVRVDCWDCHKSVPEEDGRRAGLTPGARSDENAFARLNAFVQQGERK